MLAFLFPITLDGLILAGSLLILYFAVRGKRSGYGLFLTALGVIVSIAGNVVISPKDITYQILHATSPVVLFLALESLMILLRARSRNAQEAEEKEIAEKKLSSDNYFHHKADAEPVNPSKAPEIAHLTATPQKAPKAPVVVPEPLEKVVQAQPLPVQAEEAQYATPELISEAKEPAPGLGRHSAPPATITQPEETTALKPVIEVPAKAPVVNTPALITPVATEGPSKREIIRDLLAQDPDMDANEIVNIVGGDKKYVQKLIRAERAKLAS